MILNQHVIDCCPGTTRKPVHVDGQSRKGRGRIDQVGASAWPELDHTHTVKLLTTLQLSVQ